MNNENELSASALEGLSIQRQGLAQWEAKLNPECYADLVAECDRRNSLLSEVDDLFSVFRGNSLTQFICNWRPKTVQEKVAGEILDTSNDIYSYLDSDTPLECCQRDIDIKMSQLKERVMALLEKD